MELSMTYIIPSLCVRDNTCMAICPMESINPGNPADQLAAYKNEMPLDIYA